MHEVECLACFCDAYFVIWAAYSAFGHIRTPKCAPLSLSRSMVRLYMERYWSFYACVIDARWIHYVPRYLT